MTEYNWSKYTNIYFPLTFLSLGEEKKKKKEKETLLSLLREQGEQH